MKKYGLFLLASVILGTSLYAETIKDVPTDDPGFKAMNTAVKKGYLSLYNNNAFRPTQPVTRKELAMALDSLSLDSKSGNSSLAPSDVQELSNLSKSFKGNFTGLAEQIATLTQTQAVHTSEIQTLHHDLTKTDDELRQEIADLNSSMAEIKKQRLYTWIGIGAAVVLGIAR